MLLVALALAGAPVTASKTKAQPDSPPSQMQKLLQNCDAHKFETFIEVKVEGQPQPKRSRVKLCGTEGQSDADWVRTLKDAVVKTEANLQMPPAVREQILLYIPSSPLCREDCPGLCPSCGKDLNEGECGCDRAVMDPRWAALKGIQLEKKKEK